MTHVVAMTTFCV